MPSTWLITGANSGFGKLATERLLARGDRVAALARRPETLDAIDAGGHDDWLVRIAFDLADENTIASAVDQAFAALGRIDAISSIAWENIRRETEKRLHLLAGQRAAAYACDSEMEAV